MDHQDWPGWPDDNSHLDDPHQHDQPLDSSHLDGSPLDQVDPTDLGGHGHEPPAFDPYSHDASDPDPGVDPGHGHLEPADYPDDDPFGADPLDTTHDYHDVVADQHLAEPPVGSDPDVDPYADDTWHDATFPPALDFADAPAPVDGYPWGDAGLLGDAADGDPGAAYGHPAPADLYEYAGEEQAAGGDAWQALLGSDDPATSTLARWWTPGS